MAPCKKMIIGKKAVEKLGIVPEYLDEKLTLLRM
jgi:hypothetical protein